MRMNPAALSAFTGVYKCHLIHRRTVVTLWPRNWLHPWRKRRNVVKHIDDVIDTVRVQMSYREGELVNAHSIDFRLNGQLPTHLLICNSQGVELFRASAGVYPPIGDTYRLHYSPGDIRLGIS